VADLGAVLPRYSRAESDLAEHRSDRYEAINTRRSIRGDQCSMASRGVPVTEHAKPILAARLNGGSLLLGQKGCEMV